METMNRSKDTGEKMTSTHALFVWAGVCMGFCVSVIPVTLFVGVWEFAFDLCGR